MRWLLVLLLVFSALIAGAFTAFNMGFFHAKLEQVVSEQSGARVRLGPVKLAVAWPPHVTVGPTTVDHALANVTWQGLSVDLLKITAPYFVKIAVDRPVVEMKGEVSQTPTATPPAAGGGGGAVQPIHLALRVTQGEYKGPQGRVSGIDLQFDQPQLLQSAAVVRFRALVELKTLPMPLPFALESDALTLTPETIKASDMKVSLGGLNATAQGSSLLTEDRHRWKASVAAPDLSKLPAPPLDIAARAWRGAIHLTAEVTKDGPVKPWSAEGDIDAQNVGADLQFKRDKLSVKGPFVLNLKTHFQYFDNHPVISSLDGALDLTASEVIVEALVHKAMGEPFTLKIAAQGDANQIQLRELDVKFWRMGLKVSGESKLSAPFDGKLHFEMPAVALQGAEKTFLPLARSPVQGEAELRGDIVGPLGDPMHARIHILALRFKDVSAHAEYDKPGVLQVRGPVRLSAVVSGEWNAGSLKQVVANGDLNLNEASLILGPLRKESRQPFSAAFSARNNGDVLEIGKLELNSFFAVAKLTGRIKNLLDPTLENVQLSLNPLNLSEMRIAMPPYRDLIPKGIVRGEFRLAGRRAPNRPWHDWPLDVSGSVRVQIPEYKMASTPPAPPVKAGEPPAKAPDAAEPEPFLPDGNLTQRLKLKITADVAQFVKDAMVMKNVHADGAVDKGHFRGEVTVQEVFGGSVKLSGLDVPLLDKRPLLQGTAVWQNLIIENALGFAKPEYKEFAAGRIAGRTVFATYLPADRDFMASLKAKGSAVMQPVTLNTVKIGAMLNEMLTKVPEAIRKQAKIQNVKTDPLKGLVKTEFNLHSQAVLIENFFAQDVDLSELHLKGKVVVPTLQGDLAGHFLWAKPQFQGCLLEGNSDAQGRMLIPVAIKGDLMHPSFSMLSDLINKLAGKALQCEQKKLTKSIEEKVKKEGTKKLEEEGKKLLKGLFK